MRPHISLNVRDVPTSLEFYRKVFGVNPQKQTADYAKFALTTPSLNFSLVSSTGAISAVNHFGIEVDAPDDVATWERHLHEQGILAMVEKDVVCCYARQDKVWFTDPDGNHWEVITVLEQLPVTTSLKDASCCAPTCCSATEGHT